MPDGDYFSAIATTADCGILLDLHNLWANERNGRQPVVEVLSRLPLDRVWEIHLAAGMSLHDYWLDAHSGLVDDALMQLVEQTVTQLPNLGAIIYEILPQYIAEIGLERIHRQLEDIAALWRHRAAATVVVPPARSLTIFYPSEEDIETFCGGRKRSRQLRSVGRDLRRLIRSR